MFGRTGKKQEVWKERILERETGIEPATNGLGSRYSTIELLPLGVSDYMPGRAFLKPANYLDQALRTCPQMLPTQRSESRCGRLSCRVY